MHLQSYMQSAKELLQQYKGDMPFAAWLKNYFRQHKKYGSRDRKQIIDLCFCYFRLGQAFSKEVLEERLLIGQFLCHRDSVFIQELKAEWSEQRFLSISDKLDFLDPSQRSLLFPFTTETSDEIDKESFTLSFLQQPDLFLRVRPGKEKVVLQKLDKAGIPFSQEGTCLRLSNNTKVDEVLRLDEEAVVQDISSQRVVEPLQHQTPNAKPQTAAWDCCAASGGKTILLHDTFPRLRLTVSDIRESILVNLRNRLKRAGIGSYKSFVADVSMPGFSLPQKFDIILCDAPCSGSGTWARTPEQLLFFTREKIGHYASLQKNIALNASKSLRSNGFFLYITCSVFSRENEEVVHYLSQHGNLQVLSQHYFKGYEQKGDTL
ncbi:MAG TPA: Fmu (Sun) domain-containing protein, partial [Flavisolibacter sp.]|nr:Fmu (Sun) domain-containing protein [Flavisolibacter sp.]